MKNLSSRIKILFFIDGFSNPNAGTEGQFIKIVKGLNDAAVHTQVLTLIGSDYLKSDSFPGKVDEIGDAKVRSVRTWIKILFKAIKYRFKGFKLVHFFFNDSALIGPLIFRAIGFRTITSRRDMGIWYNASNLKFLRLNRWLTNVYIANSEAVKRNVCLFEYAPTTKIRVIYNGYNFNGTEDDQIKTNPIIPFQENDIILGMVSNLRPVKRISDAIKALAIVRKKYSNVRLVIVGNHDERDPTDFLETTKMLGLENDVYFAGAKTDVAPWIQSFDICLLCSESEGFSNAVIEYMQAGKSVICSRVGGNPEIIRHGVNGLLYDKGNINELASYIERLAASPNERSRMGKSGAATVRDRYSVQRMISEHVNLYESLV